MQAKEGRDRREWRTKLNFGARAGWAARAVIPRAKTPAVHMLSISNVSSDILDAIDELAAREDRSRSSFVWRELQRVVAGYRAQTV
jgi:hypothetical protein